jgi:hypothetical protein
MRRCLVAETVPGGMLARAGLNSDSPPSSPSALTATGRGDGGRTSASAGSASASASAAASVVASSGLGSLPLLIRPVRLLTEPLGSCSS